MHKHLERIAVVGIDRQPHGAGRSVAGDREQPDRVDGVGLERDPVDTAVDRIRASVAESGQKPVIVGRPENHVDRVGGGEPFEPEQHAVGAWVFGPHVWSLA